MFDLKCALHKAAAGKALYQKTRPGHFIRHRREAESQMSLRLVRNHALGLKNGKQR